jgi:protein-tyrosine-phosphatase
MNPSLTTVLFLSTGNAARGIFAEALLRHKGGGRFVANSAGFQMLPEIAPQALELLQADGIPTDGLHTKGWAEYFAAPASILVDVIVTLSEEARANCPQWPGDPIRVHWPVDDPFAPSTSDARDWKMRKCYATLQNRVDAMVKQRTAHSQTELMLQLRNISAVV